jgi:ankyrin repeat protein
MSYDDGTVASTSVALAGVEAGVGEQPISTPDIPQGVILDKDVYFKKFPGKSLLMAVKTENVDLIVQLLQKYGADPSSTDDDGNTGMHWAAWFENASIVHLLVQAGAVVSALNQRRQTPLHWSAMSGCVPCTAVLLENGADVEARDVDGYTPALCAAQFGRTPTLDYLFLCGADVKAVDTARRSCVHWAAYNNHLITLQWAVMHAKCAVDAVDTDRRLPLHWAAALDRSRVVQYLLNELNALPARGVAPADGGGVSTLRWALTLKDETG